MPIPIDEDLYASGTGAPTVGSYILEMLGQQFRGARELTPPDHKMENAVVPGNGGTTVLGITTGVLNAEAEGSFVLAVDSAKRFRTLLQARAPQADITEIPFDIRAYAIDPIKLTVRGEHKSFGCRLTNKGRPEKFGVAGGAEIQVATFTYKSTKESDDGASVAK